MIVLALDPSLSRTGYAILHAPPVRVSAIESGSFASETPDHFIEQALALVEQVEPDMIAAEQAHKVIIVYGRKTLVGNVVATPNADQLKLSEIQGGIRGIATTKRIPVVFVPPKSWRKSVLGRGDLDRNAAKAAAVAYCARLGIPVRNHDAAESVCVGLWSATCDVFRDLVDRRKTA